MLISFLSRILFDTDAEETKTFALPLAILSQVIGFILKVIVIVVLVGVLGLARSPSSPAPSGPSGSPSGSGSTP